MRRKKYSIHKRSKCSKQFWCGRGLSSLFNSELGFKKLDSFNPKIDIKETDQDYLISVEVPGVNKDDIHVQISDNTLLIRGEKSQQHKEESEHYHNSIERSYGAFQRILSLPEDADVDRVEANHKDGVLTLSIKRLQEAINNDAKVIEVK